jgi:predicted Fe-Mo cluster-binding NifX family protein
MKMKIAVTYDNNGDVFQHFGHSEQFKIYTVDTDEAKILDSEIVPTTGSGHCALGNFLGEKGVNALICGGIGGGARNKLAEANIALFPGVVGKADQVVQELLDRTLEYNPDTVCNHHEHNGDACPGHDHDCGHDCHN